MTIYDYFDSCKATEQERELIIEYLAFLRMKGTLELPNERPPAADPPPATVVNVTGVPDEDLQTLQDHVHKYGTMEARIALIALLEQVEKKDKPDPIKIRVSICPECHDAIQGSKAKCHTCDIEMTEGLWQPID